MSYTEDIHLNSQHVSGGSSCLIFNLSVDSIKAESSQLHKFSDPKQYTIFIPYNYALLLCPWAGFPQTFLLLANSFKFYYISKTFVP